MNKSHFKIRDSIWVVELEFNFLKYIFIDSLGISDRVPQSYSFPSPS